MSQFPLVTSRQRLSNRPGCIACGFPSSYVLQVQLSAAAGDTERVYVCMVHRNVTSQDIALIWSEDTERDAKGLLLPKTIHPARKP